MRDRPLIDCCTPYVRRSWPSGAAWTHSRSCPDRPNQKVLMLQRSEVEAREDHPAGKAIGDPGQALRSWLAHPVGHTCPDCLYVENWTDRDDDLYPTELTGL